MNKFECLFCFGSNDLTIVEIKQLDIFSNKKEDIYHWIKIRNNQGNYALQRLSFVSMSQDGDEQERQFQNANFHFNSSNGVFENNEGKFELNKLHELPSEIQQLIEQFLIA